eukprot:5582199-Amphidinium_carterae.3
MRAWTSQDSSRSWSTESTVSSKIENRETRTASMGAATHQRKVPRVPPPPPPARTSSQTQESTVPPPGGPSAGGGSRLTPNPKKPADNAWRNVEITPPGVPYPDTRGMKSRPYEPDEGRPYPALEEHIVVYRSEIGNGSYPLSSIPVFSDVTGDPNGFPKDKTWLQTREIRRFQERKAFFEETGYRNPDVIPRRREDEFRDRPEPPWYTYGFRCYHDLMKICYDDPTPSRSLRHWCYVCKKGPEATVQLNRCAACNNVYMCQEHRIFLDCIPTGHGLSICCRHTRYTPGILSWNPVGGYPPLNEISEVKEQEEWLEEGGDADAVHRAARDRRQARIERERMRGNV